MGGDLALAHALRHRNNMSVSPFWPRPGISTRTTPLARAISAMADAFEPQLALLGELPTDFLQLLFCTLDPLLGFRKFFETFAKMDQSCRTGRLISSRSRIG